MRFKISQICINCCHHFMITNFFLFGEKSIDDISTYCSDPVKKRFYQKMIFKPQTGTGDNHVKKKPTNQWFFNHYVDQWLKEKTLRQKLKYMYIAISAFLFKLFRHYILYKKIYPKVHEGSMWHFQRTRFTWQFPVETSEGRCNWECCVLCN